MVSISNLFWHLRLLKSRVWEGSPVPLEVPVSGLKDVLHPKVLMEGGARELINNPALLPRNEVFTH